MNCTEFQLVSSFPHGDGNLGIIRIDSRVCVLRGAVFILRVGKKTLLHNVVASFPADISKGEK